MILNWGIEQENKKSDQENVGNREGKCLIIPFIHFFPFIIKFLWNFKSIYDSTDDFSS